MKTVELVPKKRRVWCCDQCGETEGVREYLLPYSPSAGVRQQRGRFRDLCQACQRRIQASRPDYITPETDLPRYVSARRGAT